MPITQINGQPGYIVTPLSNKAHPLARVGLFLLKKLNTLTIFNKMGRLRP